MPAAARAVHDEEDLGASAPQTVPLWSHRNPGVSIYGLEITEVQVPSRASLGHTDTTPSPGSGDRAILEKIRQLSLESRREVEELIEDLLNHEEDVRDIRSMSKLAVRALAQDENVEENL